MNLFQSLLYGIVSLLSSVVGAICGIGGGVIIKPVLDSFHWADASVISFLSGCTVLSMTLYSVGVSLVAGEKQVNLKTGTPLALGAVVGGIAGNNLFSMVKAASSNISAVGGIQAICLAIITVATLLYTLYKSRIVPRHTSSITACVFLGFFLGFLSSFLGIGGGPINLMVLGFFFAMESKTAAANSLYIILFSQISSLATYFITDTVPDVSLTVLGIMAAGGVLGGVLGRKINKKINSRTVDKLFIGLMVLIIFICIRNAVISF